MSATLPLVSRERGYDRHVWKMRTHLDGCHWFQSIFTCARCGASAFTFNERDPHEDPYSLIWMEPTSDEPCDRCDELIAGAPVRHYLRIEP